MNLVRAVYLYKGHDVLDLTSNEIPFSTTLQTIRRVFSEDMVQFTRWYFLGTNELEMIKPELDIPYLTIIDVTFNDPNVTPDYTNEQIHNLVISYLESMKWPTIYRTTANERQTYFDIALKDTNHL